MSEPGRGMDREEPFPPHLFVDGEDGRCQVREGIAVPETGQVRTWQCGQPSGARLHIEPPPCDVRPKVMVTVLAGVVPGFPDDELSRRWSISSQEWAAAEAGAPAGGVNELLAGTNGQAMAYASLLMLQPDRVNWVTTEWLFL